MALITLTRDQFLKRKPKGDYSNYLKYVNKARAGRPVGQGTGQQVQLPMDPAYINKLLLQNVGTMFPNPKQQRQQAIQSVNDAIKSALGDLRGTTAAEQKQATDQARAYEGFAKWLAGQRVADSAADQAIYSQQAQAQSHFADSLMGGIGQAAQASADANVRDAQAAAGTGAGYHGPNVQSLVGVGEYLGGYLPSANLSDNAAYAAANARAQGIAMAGSLGLQGAGMRQKAVDLQAELARERAKLIAGRPAAIRSALKDSGDTTRANLATLANIAYLQNTQAKTTAEQTGQYQGQDTINTYRDKNGVIRNYDPSRYTIHYNKDGSGFLVPLPVATGAGKGKNKNGLTPSQQATQDRMRNEALQTTRGSMLTVVQNKKGPLYNKPKVDLGEFTPWTPKSYAAAKTYLMTNFANDLIKQYPGQKARILQMVEETLSAGGFKKGSGAAAGSRVPQTGNPFFPFPSVQPGMPKAGK